MKDTDKAKNLGLTAYLEGEEDEDEQEEKEEKGSDFFAKKLLEARTIVIAREVSDKLYEKVFNQLVLLESEDEQKPIKVFVNSPGGSADSGFAIYDALRFVKPPIYTFTNGICASAAVIIFLGGDEGKRFALPNARFLIHQPSTFTQGAASDLEITAKQILKIREQYNKIVADATGKRVEQITKDADRDFWLSASEAVEYGLVSKIIKTKSELDTL